MILPLFIWYVNGYKLILGPSKEEIDVDPFIQFEEKRVSSILSVLAIMLARNQKLCAVPPIPLGSTLAMPTTTATPVREIQRENIKSCSFLLGLMMAFFDALSILTMAMIRQDLDPEMDFLFSIVWTYTWIIISSGFFHVLDSFLVHPLSFDLSEEKKAIVIRDTRGYFVLGMLLGVCSAWVVIDLWTGLDEQNMKYDAYVLAVVTMVAFILKTIMMWDDEGRFSLGMLLGVCSAWLVRENALGIEEHIKFYGYIACMLMGIMIFSLMVKTMVMWDDEHRFGLGMLFGVCSAWVVMEILYLV
jgi:MFS family permease